MSQITTPTFRESTLEKHFDFKVREPELYQKWEESGVFKPESLADSSAPVFDIAMPPPNANGELHLGHAFGYTVMDILGRFRRLNGDRVLLLPGKDHAGIQTQVVYEKKLKSEKVDLKTLSHEELYKKCYEFCIDRAHYMRAQEKTLGLSADWTKELFTLDPRLNEIVFETFTKMWNDGLIYKGTRIVNWSVFSQTSISDVEVEYKEQEGGLWYILYPLVSPSASSDEISLPNGEKVTIGQKGLVTATTRPETMLGDTALVVHPDDPRYQKFIGQEVTVPLVNRRIKVLADSRVDPAYGTGVVKVTPAHDFMDYDIGQDLKLEIIQVIGKDGKMSDAAGEDYKGLSIAEAREKVIADLRQAEMLLDTSKITHKVPIGERGKDIIEPLISEQWFVNVNKPGNSLKEQALELLRAGKINIYPARFQVLFEQWLENLRDWNISRQLWWGHQLPVYYRGDETYVGTKPPEGSGWTQDKDVFDTWFSSGQWAFSTMSAHGLCDLKTSTAKSDYFPTQTMVMGRDILFFWACRMVLLTVYRTGGVPWENIFFTGLIRDEHGQKMSKSKGNGIDPNNIIQKYGADALRLALVMGATPGNDIAMGEKKIEGYSKFINKLWNAAKLIEMKLGDYPPPAANEAANEALVPTLETSKWLLSGLAEIHEAVTKKFSQYEISIAADELYSFTWGTFCDWYLEMMKVLIDKGPEESKREVYLTTSFTFRTLLTLLHPVIPFITEEIYQKVPFIKLGENLATENWKYLGPKVSSDNKIPEILEIITAIRSVKAALSIPHKRIRVAIGVPLTSEFKLLISELGRVDFSEEKEFSEEKTLRKPFSTGIIVCEVDDKGTYKVRIEKDIALNKASILTLEKKLSGSFASQANPELVEKEREKLTSAKFAVSELEKELLLLN